MSIKVNNFSNIDGSIISIPTSIKCLGVKQNNNYFSKVIENTETNGFKFQNYLKVGKIFLNVELTTP